MLHHTDTWELSILSTYVCTIRHQLVCIIVVQVLYPVLYEENQSGISVTTCGDEKDR